jgi:hypothetical protein
MRMRTSDRYRKSCFAFPTVETLILDHTESCFSSTDSLKTADVKMKCKADPGCGFVTTTVVLRFPWSARRLLGISAFAVVAERFRRHRTFAKVKESALRMVFDTFFHPPGLKERPADSHLIGQR